ncbi:MAG: TrmH family RNA methyltransferase [Paludibacteraceae bacterium]|nr:TrmH family RNA methyltransferase [Paludibacteraceae bacterium]
MQKLTIQEMNRLSAEAFREAEKLPLVVVLDNVRSQHNVGAVFRTADAFLLEGLYLCGITPKPDTLSTNNDLHKTALGAELTVAWQAFAETMEAVKTLQARGYKVYAVEQAHHSITLEQAAQEITGDAGVSPAVGLSLPVCTNGIAIVLGHEVFGVAQEVVDACDGCIEIPQYGTKHSLNVSVTAGIVMYALATAMRGSL